MNKHGCLAVLLVARAVHADPDPVAAVEPHRPSEPHPPAKVPAKLPPGADHTAGDVDGEPVPGDESGRLDRVDPGDSAFRIAARAAMFPVKILTLVALSPIRGTLYVDNKYHVEDWYYRIFYNHDRTIGVIPTAGYATGLGGLVGAHFLDHDMFGAREHVDVSAGYGGAYHESASVGFGTGRRLGDIELTAGANFDRRPSDPFYGIGNLDLGPIPVQPIDPLTARTGVLSYLRYQEERATLGALGHISRTFSIGVHGELTRLAFANSTSGPAVGDVYMADELVGFSGGASHVYGEAEVIWNTRRAAEPWEPHAIHGEGSLVEGFAGPVHEFSGGSDFWRYGVELQHYLRLGSGPRMLVLRMRGEGVTGALDQVPFTELPYLGGDLLRGYSFERFRDRIAAFGTVQYQWDISHYVDVYLFTDVGRVFPALDQLSVDHLRLGYGVGTEIHDLSGGFVVEGSVGSSIDGGIVFTAAFSPVLDEHPTWR